MADLNENWIDMEATRTSTGTKIWVRVDPSIEAFVQTLNGGDATPEPLTDYGGWQAMEGETLMLHKFIVPLQSKEYTIGSVGTTLLPSKVDGPMNLSFLRFVGISKPAGVTFFIPGPCTPDFMKRIYVAVAKGIRQLVYDYISQITVVMKISSKEL